jgi:hypothetical protein
MQNDLHKTILRLVMALNGCMAGARPSRHSTDANPNRAEVGVQLAQQGRDATAINHFVRFVRTDRSCGKREACTGGEGGFTGMYLLLLLRMLHVFIMSGNRGPDRTCTLTRSHGPALAVSSFQSPSGNVHNTWESCVTYTCP